jgi:mannose-1-phosphate guanylyltransferase
MRTDNFCVIMAGGVGSRFWPLSRSAKPKQFLDILGTGKSLLRQTFERFIKLFPPENILIVTSSEYGKLVREQIPEIPEHNILLEPFRRNTAPCIAYASHKIKKMDTAAKIIVAPSDHLIIKEDIFLEVVRKGLDFVGQENALLTLGITPSRPETGYGYIQIDSEETEMDLKESSISRVKTFTEKPDYKMAKVFVESGDFYWNAGIFFWSLESILYAMQRHLPEVDAVFSEGDNIYFTPEEEKFIAEAYSGCKNISIDYGVMEKASNVFVLTSDFGWSDLGTWGSLYEQKKKNNEGNSIVGEKVMTYDLENCIINMPDEKLVVLQGLKNYIVVESDGVLLICKMKDEQKIKNIVLDVRLQKGEKFI